MAPTPMATAAPAAGQPPPQPQPQPQPAKVLKYCSDLEGPIQTAVSREPRAPVHRVEWRKCWQPRRLGGSTGTELIRGGWEGAQRKGVMSGDPVEINPSIGSGYKVMSVGEWSSRWKRNDDFPACLAEECGSSDTREHYFTQTWCRGKRVWASESLCMSCHRFSWRSYRDPDFKTPEQYEKEVWEAVGAAGGRP
ncbi:hypothetical protein VOLCADRAFT_90712 [Volvox carteri f. nagariensis]|uniref:Uncharacterized protein n=1 Tax=Volvox carteri f. nagariensis TaxID=3068 RepID=D8TVI8_VOLCA|nr:uncharacterized protein VOLCADRAFT_90712 [Volvox carteri f. nagariensis]EFJ48586.1 hypothetical protein VOLCADRAFT_90712 [Volvox carteri f. nagariensis]|eukprot:XP_002950385.1 hypothetical protein VOLCADRAFT_90712 [Volvox carteri f. nagariensis]